MRCISAIYVKECLKFSLTSRNIQEGLQIKDECPPEGVMDERKDILIYSSLFTLVRDSSVV
jgi:hypothetical protein